MFALRNVANALLKQTRRSESRVRVSTLAWRFPDVYSVSRDAFQLTERSFRAKARWKAIHQLVEKLQVEGLLSGNYSCLSLVPCASKRYNGIIKIASELISALDIIPRWRGHNGADNNDYRIIGVSSRGSILHPEAERGRFSIPIENHDQINYRV